MDPVQSIERAASLDILGLGSEIPKFIINLWKSKKNKKEASINVLMFLAVESALNQDYYSFNISGWDKNILFNKINYILTELRIHDITMLVKKDTISKFVNKLKESRVIEVETVNGDGGTYDIEQFYCTFEKYLKSILNNKINNNEILTKTLEMELQKLSYNNSEDIKDVVNEIKDMLLNIKSMLDEASKKEEENNNILIASMGEYNEVDYSYVVDLKEDFNGKKIKETTCWDIVAGNAQTSYMNLKRKLSKDGINNIYLSLHLSLAYHAGACFNEKGMHNLRLMQKTPRGIVDWSIDQSISLDEYEDKKFKYSNNLIDENNNDIVISISTRAKRLYDPEGDEDSNDLNAYLSNNEIKARRILDFNMGDKGGNFSVKNGTHARFLAEQVRCRIDSLSRKDRQGKMHVFLATPVSLAFFLGQISFDCKEVQLYEFIDRTYVPSIFIKNVDELGS